MKRLFNHRFLALIQKEFAQIRRDRRIAMSLILPPVLQLMLFGFVLNSKVQNLRLGVIDESRTPESRELIARLSESESFRLTGYFLSPDALTDAITHGKAQAGLIVPSTTTQETCNAAGKRTYSFCSTRWTPIRRRSQEPTRRASSQRIRQLCKAQGYTPTSPRSPHRTSDVGAASISSPRSSTIPASLRPGSASRAYLACSVF